MKNPILFDFDGTLANTLPLYIKAYSQALKEQGFSLSDKQIVETCFGTTEATICNNLGIPDKTDQFTRTYFNGVDVYFKQARLFDHALDFLQLAKQKQIKLVIISFAYRWYLDRMIKRLNLNQYFDLIIGFDDIKKPKPNPEAVILACKKLGEKPHDAVVIGDSKSDIVMGKSSKAKTILFHPNEYNLFYDLETLKQTNPDHVVKNFKQIKQLLIPN